MLISNLIDKYLTWCAHRRAAATVRQYKSRLKPFVETFGDRDVTDLRALEITEYFDAAVAGKAPDTHRAYVVAFESFQTWCVEQELLLKRIVKRLDKPAGRKRERIPTVEETEAILAAGSPEFRLIYRALRQTGARPNELCRAQVADIQDGVIVLKEHKTAQKTGKPRRIGVGQKFREIINESLGVGTAAERSEGHLFLSPRRTPWTPGSLGATYRRIRDRLGLAKDLCLYLARHEHATLLCEARGVHAASESLGHANIQTTMRYVKASDESLKNNQDLVE